MAPSLVDTFLAELALLSPVPPTDEELRRIARALGLDPARAMFARWLVATGRLSDAR